MEHGSDYLWVHDAVEEDEEMEVDYANDIWAQQEQRLPQPSSATTTTSPFGGLMNTVTSSVQNLFGTNAAPQQQQQQPPPPAPTSAKIKKLRFRQADTNVLKVDFGTLGEEASLATGDPVYCTGCKALFSSISQLKKNPIESKDDIWACEFCGIENEVQLFPEEIPKSNTVDYIIAPPSTTTVTEDSSLVVFCVDISGSMGVSYEIQGKLNLKGNEKVSKLNELNSERTANGGFADQWLPRENRDITYVTRLQCVQAAIDNQFDTLSKNSPQKKVGLVTFSNEVTILGDGTKQPTIISGDKLNSYDQLFEIGSKYDTPNIIKSTKNDLSKKLFTLEEGGSTALGPALVAALGICSQARGSKIVICTDGLSNVGLGSLDELSTDDEKLKASQFYQQVGLYAKNQGITVSVISIKGSDCSIENLGQLADLTTGIVERVDPLNITKDFQTILSLPVIATNVTAKILLHKGLFVRSENGQQSTETKDVGNITKETNVTFEYGIRTDYKKEEFNQLKSLPFQLQISYLKLDGMKCMRVITKTQEITFDQKIAEEKANVKVLCLNSVQQTAKLASKGDYAKARAYNYSNKVMLERAATTEDQQTTYGQWMSHGREFEQELTSVQKKEMSEGLDDLDDEDEVEEKKEAKKESRDRARKGNRSDETASMLYKFKNHKKY